MPALASRDTAALGTDASASAPPPLRLDPEEIYAARTLVFADGSTRRETVGQLLLPDRDGVLRPIDPRAQLGPDGNRWTFGMRAWQHADDDPVTYELRVRRAPTVEPAATPPPPQPTAVSDHARAWMSASDAAPAHVIVEFPETAPVHLPHVPDAAAIGTEAWLDAMEARVWWTEARKTAVDASLADVAAWLNARGIRSLGRAWSSPSLSFTAGPALVGELIRVWQPAQVSLVEPLQPDANNGIELRRVTQAKHLIQTQHTGAHGASGGRVRVAIYDRGFAPFHPAWIDPESTPVPPETVGSRLRRIWTLNVNQDPVLVPWPSVQSQLYDSHGTTVAGIGFGDLTEGQDPNVTDPTQQKERSGISPESYLDFLDTSETMLPAWADFLLEEGHDILNRSGSSQGSSCANNTSDGNNSNRVFLGGTFFVQTPGNQVGCSGWQTCNYQGGEFAGAFVTNALGPQVGDLDTGPVQNGCRGGDLGGGRSVISLVAPGVRENATIPWSTGTVPNVSHTYKAAPAFTSYAAPVAAGAAANVKDFLYQYFPEAASDPGFLHAMLLLMTDGQRGDSTNPNQPGTFAGTNAAFDPVWGGGRLKLRKFTEGGMDAPWDWGIEQVLVFNGVTVPLNGFSTHRDDPSLNLIVPSDVDRLRAAMWWFEPNVPLGLANVASITTRWCNPDTNTCETWADGVQRQRYRRSTGVANRRWRLELEGDDIPASSRFDYLWNTPARFVYATWYMEDGDRDDANGPEAYIQ